MQIRAVPRSLVLLLAASWIAGTTSPANAGTSARHDPEDPSSRRIRHEVTFEAGMAWDSNPFLSPSDDYVDPRDGSSVEPVRQSGFYIPTRLHGLLTTRRSFVEYRLHGNFFLARETRNAEEYDFELKPGFDFQIGNDENRDRTIRIAPFAAYSKDVYFDRETGLAGEVGGIDASDRYSYRSFGGEVELDFEATRSFGFTWVGEAERRDYEDVRGIESFDHDRASVLTELEFRLSRVVRWTLEHQVRRLSYEERESKDLGGSSSPEYPRLEYDYRSTGTELQLRPGLHARISLKWQTDDRIDRFAGYNDYRQERLRLRTRFEDERWSLTLGYGWRDREYDRAFVFDEPVDPDTGRANPFRRYDRRDVSVRVEFPFRRLRLALGGERTDQDGTDPRFSYERTRWTIGTVWVF